MNTPRTDALLEDIESCADAIDWAENPTDIQLVRVYNWFKPEHKCYRFKEYTKLNLKICEYCYKHLRMWD